MAWEIIKSLHKGGSSTTNVQSYTPTKEEVRLQKASADYAEYVAPNARWLNDTAANVLKDSIGTVQVDFNKMNNTAQKQIANAQQGVANLTTGQLPAQYQANMEASLQRGIQNTMGTALNGLAQRGVLNSSVTNSALSDMSKSVSDTMAEQYQNNIGILNGLYGQQSALATSGIQAGAAAQEAALAPALSEWNASLGLNGAGTSALGAVSGQGTTTSTSTTSGGGSGWLGGLVGLGSAAIGAFCFAGDSLVDTPNGCKEIRNIKVGDIVMAYDEEKKEVVERKVVKVQKPATDFVVELTIENKDTDYEDYVMCTGKQPLLMANGEWQEVDLIKIGTELEGGCVVVDIQPVGEISVYDIKVEGNNNYIVDGVIAEGMFDE